MTPKITTYKNQWYNWPSNKNNSLVPWYVIIRRATFWPLLLVSYLTGTLGVYLAYGKKETIRFHKNFF